MKKIIKEVFTLPEDFIFKKFKITTLTPMHIKSGKEIGVFEYYVDGGKVCIPGESLFKALEQTGNEENFRGFIINCIEQPTRQGQQIGLQDFINRNPKVLNALRKLPHYLNFSAPQDFISRRTQISLTARSADQPFIPGSTIKGLIKTAIFAAEIYKNKKLNLEVIEKLESFSSSNEQLKDAKIFQNLIVRDFFSKAKVKTSLLKFQRIKKRADNKERGIPVWCESIEEGSEFYGEIGIRKTHSFDYTFDDIIDYLTEFYHAVLEYEINELTDSNIKLFENSEMALELMKEKESEPVIKIGFAKGIFANSVLLKIKNEGNKDIYEEIIRKNYRRLKEREIEYFPTTYFIVNGKLPGWCKIEEV